MEFTKSLFEDCYEDSIPVIDDIHINSKDILEAISKLSNKSGPGPDGVPPHCYKNGGDFILDVIEDITRLILLLFLI